MAPPEITSRLAVTSAGTLIDVALRDLIDQRIQTVMRVPERIEACRVRRQHAIESNGTRVV